MQEGAALEGPTVQAGARMAAVGGLMAKKRVAPTPAEAPYSVCGRTSRQTGPTEILVCIATMYSVKRRGN